MAEGVFTQGAELRGNNNILVREFAALDHNAEFDSLDDATYSNIETLICSGYSYRQARAAVVAAEIFVSTIDELCAAKIEELTADEDESDSSSYPIKVLDSVSTENEEYKALATNIYRKSIQQQISLSEINSRQGYLLFTARINAISTRKHAQHESL